jgi:1,4-dihydroxy-2-naphthoate octaprenyltransferase
VNAERRVSISSHLILSWRARAARPEGVRLGEPLWRRWYAPLLMAALGLIGLMLTAIALLAVITATPPARRPAAPLTQHEQADEVVRGMETMRTER